jgi:hypothetical protein
MNRSRTWYSEVASASGDASGSNPARPKNRSASGVTPASGGIRVSFGLLELRDMLVAPWS